jgi:hypothetical protein
MNTNDYTPKFKKTKKTGYHKEKEASSKLSNKKTVNSAETPIAKVSIKKSIKNSISSAIEYVKSFKRKSKKNTNNEVLQSSITTFEEKKLDVLENEMINMVENVKVVESEAIEDSNIFNKFGDIIKNLTIELHNSIGFTEQTNAIEQSISVEEPKEVQEPKEVEQTDKNLNELNSILNFLADNILDDKKKKKEFSFCELTTSNTSTYTIRVISLGIAISYTTLEEFIEKIANRAGTVKSLCWFAGCPEQFNIELKKFIDLNNATQKDYDKIFKTFKNMIDAYLSKKKPEIHSKIVQVINLTGGGKKRKPKKATTNVRKPKKTTTNVRKPKKAITNVRKPKKAITNVRKPKKATLAYKKF